MRTPGVSVTVASDATDSGGAPAAARTDLEAVAGKGSGWLTLINLLSRGAQMLMTLVLAAIFTEAQMGLVALVLAVLNIGQVIMSMGVFDVVSHAEDARAAAGTVATLSVGVAALIATVAFLGAAPFAELLGAPDATDLIRVCFVSLPFTAYAAVQIA